MIRFADFELAPARRALRRNGEPVAIRERALDVLLALVDKAGQVVSKGDLCRRVWPEREVDENNLQVEILRLRRLLGKHAIVTASGRGYQFALPVQSTLETGEEVERPDPRVELIGREEDLAAVEALLVPGGLVTVTGEGGIGKTSVALAVVARREAELPASTCYIGLDEIDPDDEPALARLRAKAFEAARAATLSAGQTMLVVLDGCDRVVPAMAVLAVDLAGEPSPPAVLATSRELLRARGERVVRLGPLEFDTDADGEIDTAARTGSAASRLFTRAYVAAGGDATHVDNPESPTSAQIAALCRELDGNPLAIGLAARRAAAIGIEALRKRLAETIDVLDAAESTAPSRQRSLRASFDWSYERLSAFEQRVHHELSALPQPFLLAQLLALPHFARTDPWELMEALTRLVEKSMATADQSDPPRYRINRVRHH